MSEIRKDQAAKKAGPADKKSAAPAKAAPSRPVAAVRYSKHPVHYTVRKGDTVLSVADDFGVPAEKVRQWNRVKGNALHTGRSLMIFKSGQAAVEPTSATTTSRRHPRSDAAPHTPQHGAHASAKSAGKGKGPGSASAAKAPAGTVLSPR